MLIKRETDLKYSDITPREDYLNRRDKLILTDQFAPPVSSVP